MARRDQKKNSPLSSIISVVLALAFLEPRLLVAVIPLAIFGGAVWLGIRFAKKGGSKTRTWEDTTYLRECSVPLSLHRDRSEHYVRKGNGQDPWDNLSKEIDPWDRPDIDIRKYQRNR